MTASLTVSLCYAIFNAMPDYRKYITQALLWLRIFLPDENANLMKIFSVILFDMLDNSFT